MTPKPHKDESDRLTRLEMQQYALSKQLYGNGQPGDIQRIMSKLDQLQAWHWKQVGAFAAMTVLIPVIVVWVEKAVKSVP